MKVGYIIQYFDGFLLWKVFGRKYYNYLSAAEEALVEIKKRTASSIAWRIIEIKTAKEKESDIYIAWIVQFRSKKWHTSYNYFTQRLYDNEAKGLEAIKHVCRSGIFKNSVFKTIPVFASSD